MINKDRLVAVTDGIIAVAATVMVLKLDVPDKASMEAIRQQWPTMLAYMISFAQIFLAWHEHHDTFVNAEKINHRVFLLNCLWLFFITLVPFVTGVVGNSPNHKWSVLLYLAVMTAQIITLNIECTHLERLNNIEMQDAEVIKQIRKITYIAIAIAAVCTFMMPVIGIAIIVAVSVLSIILIIIYDRKSSDN